MAFPPITDDEMQQAIRLRKQQTGRATPYDQQPPPMATLPNGSPAVPPSVMAKATGQQGFDYNPMTMGYVPGDMAAQVGPDGKWTQVPVPSEAAPAPAPRAATSVPILGISSNVPLPSLEQPRAEARSSPPAPPVPNLSSILEPRYDGNMNPLLKTEGSFGVLQNPNASQDTPLIYGGGKAALDRYDAVQGLMKQGVKPSEALAFLGDGNQGMMASPGYGGGANPAAMLAQNQIMQAMSDYGSAANHFAATGGVNGGMGLASANNRLGVFAPLQRQFQELGLAQGNLDVNRQNANTNLLTQQNIQAQQLWDRSAEGQEAAWKRANPSATANQQAEASRSIRASSPSINDLMASAKFMPTPNGAGGNGPAKPPTPEEALGQKLNTPSGRPGLNEAQPPMRPPAPTEANQNHPLVALRALKGANGEDAGRVLANQLESLNGGAGPKNFEEAFDKIYGVIGEKGIADNLPAIQAYMRTVNYNQAELESEYGAGGAFAQALKEPLHTFISMANPFSAPSIPTSPQEAAGYRAARGGTIIDRFRTASGALQARLKRKIIGGAFDHPDQQGYSIQR